MGNTSRRTQGTRWNPRAAAAEVLVRVEEGARATEAVTAALNTAEASGRRVDVRDRRLMTELVYGVLRQLRRLDHSLASRVSQGLGRLEPRARALLRIGAYQLFMLDRIPGPIAVSATQDAAMYLRAGRLKGLLNAVLRRLHREGERLPSGNSDHAIGVRASLPDWIVELLRLSYGDAVVDAEAMALRERPLLTLRPTLTKGGAAAASAALKDEGLITEPGPHGTLVLVDGGDPFRTKAYAQGLFVAQDPASVSVVDLCGEVKGLKVLDLCAGRGIKATALADRGAEVLAVDLVADKLEQTRRLAERLGLSERIHTRVCDPTARDYGPEIGMFPRVLVDAPCTGLGTLRRHPEIAWRVTPDDVHRLARIQANLVTAGARHVAPGGELVYAVCSFAPLESRPPLLEGFDFVEGPTTVAPSGGTDAFVAWRARRREGC